MRSCVKNTTNKSINSSLRIKILLSIYIFCNCKISFLALQPLPNPSSCNSLTRAAHSAHIRLHTSTANNFFNRIRILKRLFWCLNQPWISRIFYFLIITYVSHNWRTSVFFLWNRTRILPIITILYLNAIRPQISIIILIDFFTIKLFINHLLAIIF